MNCPICNKGEVEYDFIEPEADANLTCDNPDCESYDYGIESWLIDNNQKSKAEKFRKEWQEEFNKIFPSRG